MACGDATVLRYAARSRSGATIKVSPGRKQSKTSFRLDLVPWPKPTCRRLVALVGPVGGGGGEDLVCGGGHVWLLDWGPGGGAGTFRLLTGGVGEHLGAVTVRCRGP